MVVDGGGRRSGGAKRATARREYAALCPGLAGRAPGGPVRGPAPAAKPGGEAAVISSKW